MKQKISPFLWFDKDAEEAVKLYTSAVSDSSIGDISRYGKEGFEVHHMPEGTVMTVRFMLGGMEFTALNGGPFFKANPSVSFHIKCATAEEVDAVWNKLAPGGKVLMELGSYPFSEHYGWIQDKYGFSWQVIQLAQPFTQKITPVFMFVQSMAGRAEEAMNFYISVFKDSRVNMISRYGKGKSPEKETNISYASFVLEGTEFGVMDSSLAHEFSMNEAVSMLVRCNSQEETDYFWDKLTKDGGQESNCGWLKDKFGVSWQITPDRLNELISDPDPFKAGKAMNAMLAMKKIDIAKIEAAVAA